MAIIKEQMQPEQAAPAAPAEPPPAQPGGRPDLRGAMKVPAGREGQLDALVTAGRKLMFGEALDQDVQQLLKTKGPVGEAIGQGVLGLLGIIFDKSNGSVPQDLLIPAGVLLVPEAAEYIRDLGRKVSPDEEAEGTAVFVELLLEKAGVSPDQLPQLLGSQAQPAQPTPANAEEAMQ